MNNRMVRHVAVCAAALMLCPISSGAQTLATSFVELRGLLQDGDEVVVTGSDGRRSQGRLLTVTPSSLYLLVETPKFLVLVRRTQQMFSENAVTRVQRMDSRWEGALIGLSVGFVSFSLAACGSDWGSVDCSYALIFFSAPLGVLSAFLGGEIDRMRNQTVYRAGTLAPDGATVSLSPFFTRRATGALLNVRF